VCVCCICAPVRVMCLHEQVVIQCVGPYRHHGLACVKACVEAGSDYVDITGVCCVVAAGAVFGAFECVVSFPVCCCCRMLSLCVSIVVQASLCSSSRWSCSSITRPCVPPCVHCTLLCHAGCLIALSCWVFVCCAPVLRTCDV